MTLLPFRRTIVTGLLLTVILAFGGCVSLGGVYGQTDSGSSGTSGSSDASGGDSGETEESGSEPDGGDTDPVVSGSRPGDADAPFFRVTEDYWVQTPWFGVSSFIVMVRRTTPPTQIIVPPESLLANVMQPVDNVVPALPTDHRLDRIRININFHMGNVPPFVDPVRYANPEDHR